MLVLSAADSSLSMLDAYPPDLNFLLARVIASCHATRTLPSTALDTPARTAARPSRTPPPTADPEPRRDTSANPDSDEHPADPHDSPPRELQTARTRDRREPFQRGLGTYPLRHQARDTGAAVLLTRQPGARRLYGRSTNCAFLTSPSADPKTRKQALADDEKGWTAAERAEIANHQSNGSWTMIDRSEVPEGRAFIRLI
eukprot:2359649-Pleurochrysis_carterae.AAC.1